MSVLLDGSLLEQYVRDAGFEDIKVKIVKVEIGNWGRGSFWIMNTLIIDTKLHNAGQVFISVCVKAFEALVDTMTECYPSEEDRLKMKEGILSGLTNPNYHLYIPLYVPLLSVVADSSYVVMGRKPDVPIT